MRHAPVLRAGTGLASKSKVNLCVSEGSNGASAEIGSLQNQRLSFLKKVKLCVAPHTFDGFE